MKYLLRYFLINLAALWITTRILPGFIYSGGAKSLIIGTIGLMVVNIAIVPLLKIMFLPLNILTLGLFTWAINVVGLYLLTTILPQFKLIPYEFAGANFGMVIIPAFEMSVLQVAVIASFLIGFISNFLHWLTSK